MMEKWTLYIAEKYIRSRRREKRNTTLKLSIAGIAAGVITLISVISIMNGLQMGYIEDILEITSYHVRVEDSSQSFDREKAGKVRGVTGIVSFYDLQSLVEGKNFRLDPLMVRALDEKVAASDESFISQLNIIEGDFDISSDSTIVIGNELAKSLRINLGDSITLMALSGAAFSSLKPARHDFIVKGIFKSGYYEYDRNLSFISIESGSEMRSDTEITYGIKIKNIYKDREIISKLRAAAGNDTEIVSWRDFNRVFFSALRMEKVTMMFLIGLIFIVIGVNIYNSIKRSVAEKMEDIAVLYSIGGAEKSVKQVFLMEGLIIGLSGGFIGIAAGLLVITNINRIFMLAGLMLQWILDFVSYLFSVTSITGPVNLSIFPENYFYLTEIPYRILFHEVLMIFIFALLSALFSAYFASRKISVKTPAEYLRYE